MTTERKEISHIIGCARTIRTAVMVCEYIRVRAIFYKINPDAVRYRFKDPTPENGNWSADIVVTTYASDLECSSQLCEVCRAFVAGAGEVWA